MSYFEFIYWYSILSVIGFVLIFFRDDFKSIFFDMFYLLFRVWYISIIHFLICFLALPFTVPFSLFNIIKKIFKR